MPRESTDTIGGWYPGADPIGIPEGNYAVGRDLPLAVVLHIIDGTLISAINWFTNPASNVSSHFGIGKNGTVKQFVSIKDTSFANGLSWNNTRKCWVDPDGNLLLPPKQPAWSLLRPPRNPNYYTITIEREGKPADIPTEAMDKATVKLLQWLADQHPTQLRPYRALVNLIGHRHIAPIHRAGCPGPHVDFTVLAARANPPPKPTPVLYRAIAPMWISERPSPRGPVALGGRPEAFVYQNDTVVIDEVRADGFAHTQDGRGFLPIGGLEMYPITPREEN